MVRLIDRGLCFCCKSINVCVDENKNSFSKLYRLCGIDVNYIACKLVCTFVSFLYLLVENLKICCKIETPKNIIPTLKIFFFDYKDTPIQKKKSFFSFSFWRPEQNLLGQQLQPLQVQYIASF